MDREALKSEGFSDEQVERVLGLCEEAVRSADARTDEAFHLLTDVQARLDRIEKNKGVQGIQAERGGMEVRKPDKRVDMNQVLRGHLL